MSSLAFDKQGRPFKLHARARRFRVYEFNNPGTRGTCANCYDDDGELLYVDADITYLEFAKIVGDGFFRLKQCDENGVEIDEKEAPAAFVNVHARTRNQFGASGGDSLDPRDAVILHLTQSNQELARTNAEIAKAALAQHAAVMMASANLMREYTAAPPPPRISVIEASHGERDDESPREDDDDDDQADNAPEAAPVPGWMPIYQEVKPHLPAIGGFLYAKIMEVLRSKTASPAAAPTPAAESSADADTTAPSPGSAANGAAAGPSAPSASTANTSESSASSGASASPPSATPSAETSTETANGPTPPTEATEPPATTPSGTPRNAPAVSPTPEQIMRLLEIRSKLTPAEIAIAEHAIKRMSGDVLAQWLADLTARPIDDAVRTVRSLIAQARRQHSGG